MWTTHARLYLRTWGRFFAAIALAFTITPATWAQSPAKDPVTGAFRPPLMPVEHRIGVAFESPRYKPNGKLGPEILVEGAQDAYQLGFRTLKIAMSSQVVNPAWQFYGPTTNDFRAARDLAELARVEVFRRTFNLPFRTFVIMADALGEGWCWDKLATPGKRGQPRPTDVPLTPAVKEAMYRQLHDLAAHLLRSYRNTGKVFILQDAETDWRVLPYEDEALDPSDIALENAFQYLRLRQQAVNGARRESSATGVYVYNCVEVNLVRKAMSGRRTIANTILPRLDCDLVGYSSYDTLARGDGSFAKAVAYLRTKARPSFAFGRNNVAVTELGIPERSSSATGIALDSLLQARAMGVPWVIHWCLYDNDTNRKVGDVEVPIFDATESDCQGLWVRKPNGEFGRLFLGYRPYLRPVTAPEPVEISGYIDRAYRLLLDRPPDPVGASRAARLIDEAPWDKERVIREIMLSPEYRARTVGSSAAFVVDVHRVLLGRDPEPAMLSLLEGNYATDAARLAYLAGVTASDESRRLYIAWLYRRYLHREPDSEGLRDSLELLRRGAPRAEVHARFVAAQYPDPSRGIKTK